MQEGIEPVGVSMRGQFARIRTSVGNLGAFASESNSITYRSCLSLLAAASLLLLGSCSKGSRLASVGAKSAPVPVSETALEAAPEPDQVAMARETESLESDSAIEETGRGEFDESSTEEAGIPIPFDPEEPATSEDEIALLDELIELTLPEAPRVLSHEEALLHTRSELPLVMNQHVQRLINYFTKTRRGTATIRGSIGRGSAYRAMIGRILEEEGVPAEIYYLAMAESGFRPKARSHAAATGMWQFIASRGKQYGLRRDRYQDLRYDAETATRAAAKHLKDLHLEFNDWYLAMAAYNGGPNRIKSAIRRTGSRDYWEMVRRRVLPRETRNYVPIILAMTYVGQNLDLFDIGEIDFAPPHEYDTVRTTAETSFALIADATGTSVESIKDLNLALYRSATPPYAYDLRLPKGTGERFEREIALIPADKRLNWRRYEVRQGETLKAVAHRYKVKPETLASLNSLPEGAEVEGGMRLTVPTTTRLAIYRYYGGGRAGGLLEPGTGRYRIASGDTLGGIARRFGTTVSNLLSWNGLTSTRIRAGRYLIVMPEGVGAAAASAGSAPGGRYTVRRGDSLSAIGARFGASVAQLKAWNGMRGTTIRVGQTLKVPGPSPARASPQPRASASAGMPSRPAVAPSPNHYRIRSGDNLSAIASRFGVSVRDLQSWNGLRGTRIRAGRFLIVRPPSRSSASTASPPTSRNATARYIVRRGDTLGGIAQRHGVSAAKLRSWNSIRGSRIHPGDALIVKEQANARPSGGTPSGASVSGSTTYQVKRGDNLQAIANRHGVTVSNLLAWNNLRSSRIYPGQTLAVRGNSGSRSYRIRRGDTLAGIAKRFNVTVNDLKRWNRLRSTVIHPGNTLVIQSSGS